MIDTDDDAEAALGARLRRACEWIGPVLVERDDDEEEWFGHWSPDWACWEIKPSHPSPRAMIPCERLLGADGEIDPGFLVRRSARLMIAAGIRGPHPAPEELACAADVLAAEAATRAHWRRYVDAIPEAHRRLVGPVARDQWRLLMALAGEPALYDDLAGELAAVGPGYVFACLGLAGCRLPSAAADGALLAKALRGKRHTMLARLARRPVTKAQARLLCKLNTIVHRNRMLRMLALADDPALAHVLGHMPVLKASLCRVVVRMPRAMIVPDLLAMLARIDCEVQTGMYFIETARRIERRAPERREAFLQAAARARDDDGLGDLVRDWDAKLDRRRKLRPPFPGDERLVPLFTASALHEAGRRFGNCLSRRETAELCATGGNAHYEWRGKHPAIVSLSRDSGAWAIAEIADARGQTPPRRDCKRIARQVYQRLSKEH